MIPREMPALGFSFDANASSDVSLFESCYKDVSSSSLHMQYIPCRGYNEEVGLSNLLIIKCIDDQAMNSIASSAILENYINLLMFNQKFEDADAQFKILSQKFPDNKNLQNLEEKINSKLDKSSEIPPEQPPL